MRTIKITATGSRLPPVLAIEDTGPGDWPAGWQRMVAFRVRQGVPRLRIVDAGAE